MPKTYINQTISWSPQTDSRTSNETKADFDSFIDEILEYVGPALIEEEIRLPDFMERFQQKVLFITLHGSAKVF